MAPSNEDYKKLFRTLSGVAFEETPDSSALKDNWQTEEQKKRDVKISELLTQYVKAYSEKVSFVISKRNAIVELLLWAISILIITIVVITFIFCFAKNGIEENLIAIISSYVSILSLIFGLLTTITKYIFPENDEKYITEIVSSIQKNDLENKKLNIDASKSKNEEKAQE